MTYFEKSFLKLNIKIYQKFKRRNQLMNWLTNFVKPKLSALVGNRKNVPDNLWQNCPKCGNMLHHKDLYENFHVCNSCNYHFRMTVDRRIEILFGAKNFKCYCENMNQRGHDIKDGDCSSYDQFINYGKKEKSNN